MQVSTPINLWHIFLTLLGEGTKRVCREHGNLGTKITKLNYLFLTELDWRNWSGIAGKINMHIIKKSQLIFGAADIVHYLNDTATKDLTIMGPTNLTDLAIATRYTLFWYVLDIER